MKETSTHRTGFEPTITSINGCLTPDPGIAEAAARLDDSRGKLIILVVEDDMAMRLFYGMALADSRYGTELHYATDGWQGLLLAGKLRPGLILCDLNTPRFDGFGFLDSLSKACPEMAETEVVAVTGLSADAIAAKGGLPAGVQVLHKPVSMRALSRIVLNARERHLHATQTP